MTVLVISCDRGERRNVEEIELCDHSFFWIGVLAKGTILELKWDGFTFSQDGVALTK